MYESLHKQILCKVYCDKKIICNHSLFNRQFNENKKKKKKSVKSVNVCSNYINNYILTIKFPDLVCIYYDSTWLYSWYCHTYLPIRFHVVLRNNSIHNSS